MAGEFRSILKPVSRTTKVEGSKFIASAFPISDSSEVEESLGVIRRKFFDASHNPFAYVLGAEGTEFRYSDDGEPSGTAGIRIYSVLQANRLVDLLIVVTRYFGGKKLGMGGLGRAYHDAALGVVSNAVMVVKRVFQDMRLAFPYEETGSVMSILSRHHVRISETTYDDDVGLNILVRQEEAAPLAVELRNATRGNIAIRSISAKVLAI